MACKTEERDSRRKVCLETEGEGQTKVQNAPFEVGAVGMGILDDNTYQYSKTS